MSTIVNWREKTVKCHGEPPANIKVACEFKGILWDPDKPDNLRLLPVVHAMDADDSAIGGLAHLLPTMTLDVGSAVAAMGAPTAVAPKAFLLIAAVSVAEEREGQGGGLVFLTPSQLLNRKEPCIIRLPS